MIWKDIPNWEEYYEINNYGEVRNKKSKNNTGECKKYEFAIDLAIEINVTKRTILNYLQGKSKGYLNKNISSIKYL